MRYGYQTPHPSLAEYVRTVLIMDTTSDGGNSELPLVLAGVPAVIFEFRKQPSEALAISVTLYGIPIPPDYAVDETNDRIIVYFFKPFVLACLFNLPAKMLAAGPCDLSAVKARETHALRKLVRNDTADVSLVGRLNEFFEKLIHSNRHLCEAVKLATDRMMLDPGKDMVARLPDELSMTQRTFQRVFKKYVGISANEYRRICQFQQSFQQVRAREFGKLSDVAADNGFADQSHFVRSFREFTSVTPGKYLEDGLGHS